MDNCAKRAVYIYDEENQDIKELSTWLGNKR